MVRETAVSRGRCPLTTSTRKRLAANKLAASVQETLPAGLSQPALRALAGAGITHLKHFTKVKQADVAHLHGMGPKGIRIIQEALKREGLSFAR